LLAEPFGEKIIAGQYIEEEADFHAEASFFYKSPQPVSDFSVIRN
jgi:hypothetical protein